MEIKVIISALLLGLVGSYHCLAMCGPIAFTLSIDKRYRNRLLIQNLVYQLGRVITYTILGMIGGIIGKSFNIMIGQGTLSIIIGGLLIISTLFSLQKIQRLIIAKPINLLVSKLKQYLSYYIKRSDYKSFLIIGLLNGLLPCGLVYMALTSSLVAGSILNSAFFMTLFGFGTIPMMFTLVLFGNYVGISWRRRIENFLPFIVAFVGILFILRGSNLDIPFLSPSYSGRMHMHHMHGGMNHGKMNHNGMNHGGGNNMHGGHHH